MNAVRECFLCGKTIPPGENSSSEHILADSFLDQFDLKREQLTYGQKTIEYSRLKVPAHIKCNTAQGSAFENYVLGILRSMDTNIDVLATLHLPALSEVAKSVKEVLSQWLAKLHVGFIYWEAMRKNHPDPERQKIVRKYLNTAVVRALQRCLSQGHSFNVPSSLYYFRLPEVSSPEIRFDFATRHDTFVTFIKFGRHLLVSATADGYLTEEWFQDAQYRHFQTSITSDSASDPLSYLFAVAEIWAVRELLPTTPRLEFTSDAVVDRSREGIEVKASIDGGAVRVRAAELQAELRNRFLGASRSPDNDE